MVMVVPKVVSSERAKNRPEVRTMQRETNRKYAVVEHHDGERTTRMRTDSLMRARVRALMLIREHRSVVIEEVG